MSTPQPSQSRGSGRLSEAIERLAQVSQLDFDIEFFREVALRAPRDADVLKCLGQLLSMKGLHEEAVAIDDRLVALSPHDGIARYNLACSLAQIGRLGEALTALELALEVGYRDFDYLDTDADLDPLRPLADFQSLIERYARLADK